jgi:hypothetical protein
MHASRNTDFIQYSVITADQSFVSIQVRTFSYLPFFTLIDQRITFDLKPIPLIADGFAVGSKLPVCFLQRL